MGGQAKKRTRDDDVFVTDKKGKIVLSMPLASAEQSGTLKLLLEDVTENSIDVPIVIPVARRRVLQAIVNILTDTDIAENVAEFLDEHYVPLLVAMDFLDMKDSLPDVLDAIPGNSLAMEFMENDNFEFPVFYSRNLFEFEYPAWSPETVKAIIARINDQYYENDKIPIVREMLLTKSTASYWNRKGKYQSWYEKFKERIPTEGRSDNPQVELLRTAINVAYRYYNDGQELWTYPRQQQKYEIEKRMRQHRRNQRNWSDSDSDIEESEWRPDKNLLKKWNDFERAYQNIHGGEDPETDYLVTRGGEPAVELMLNLWIDDALYAIWQSEQ